MKSLVFSLVPLPILATSQDLFSNAKCPVPSNSQCTIPRPGTNDTEICMCCPGDRLSLGTDENGQIIGKKSYCVVKGTTVYLTQPGFTSSVYAIAGINTASTTSTTSLSLTSSSTRSASVTGSTGGAAVVTAAPVVLMSVVAGIMAL